MVLLATIALAGTVTKVEPVQIGNDYQQYVGIYGEGFEPGMVVRFPVRGPTGNKVSELQTTYMSSAEIKISVPAYQFPGKHDIEVVWPDGQNACVPGGLDVVFTPCEIEPVYFPVNEFTLSPDAKVAIDHNARCLVAGDVFVARMMGFADERGELLFNRDLSAQRARAVEERLRAKMGRDGERLDVEIYALGEQLPVVEGETESAWAQNRRVEMSGLRSMSERSPRCPAIEVQFDQGSATISAASRARIDKDWECYVALGVDSLVVYGAPDADVVATTAAALDEGAAASDEELTGWALGKARAEAVVRTLDSRLHVETVVWIPSDSDPKASRRYGTAALMEMYKPEVPRPVAERAAIGSCPLEFAKKAGSSEAVAPKVEPPKDMRVRYVDHAEPADADAQRITLSFGGGTHAGADSTFGAEWGILGSVFVRFGGNWFGDIHVSTPVASFAPDFAARGGAYVDRRRRNALWGGYAPFAARLGLGAEAGVASGFSDRLLLSVVADGWFGLAAEDGWRATFGLNLIWKQDFYLRRKP